MHHKMLTILECEGRRIVKMILISSAKSSRCFFSLGMGRILIQLSLS